MRRNPRETNEGLHRKANTLVAMKNETYFWVYEKPDGNLAPRLRFIGLEPLKKWLNIGYESFVWAIDTDKHVTRRRLDGMRTIWIKTSLVYHGEFSPTEAIKTIHK
jgi:hypothetical protein